MPGQDVVVRGFGFSDVENLIPVKPATLFPVASLTKTLTNIALLQLTQQGLIDPADPVAAYLPEFSVNSRFDPSPPMTIHHLQCHTSGLPRDMFKGLIASTPQPRPGLIEYLSGQYVSFVPGTKYSYSNLGYELLGMVIERVSGMSYQQFITQNILRPLGMKNSYFLSDLPDAGIISRPYVLNDRQARVEPPIRLAASAGLYSCSADFSLLLKFLLNTHEQQQIVSHSLVARMFTSQKKQDAIDVSLQWGLSWLLEDLPDPFQGHFVYQIGNTLHYNSLIALAPEYGLGLVFFSNTAGSIQPVLNVARRVIASSVEQLTGIKALAPEPVEQLPVVEPDPTMVNLIRGDYLSENMFLQIFAIHGDVVLKVGGEAFQLFANEDGWFRLNPELRFRVQQMGQAKILMMENNGFVAPDAIEVNPDMPLHQDIAQRLGTYYLANVDPEQEEVFYQKLKLQLDQNDILQVTLYLGDFHRELFGLEASTYNLMPAGEGNMIFAGFGMYRGETLFLDQDEDGYIVSFSGLEFYRPFSSVQ
ncbi:MAG: serine hydrolase domain-containing protein [Bacteroidales bacterium]